MKNFKLKTLFFALSIMSISLISCSDDDNDAKATPINSGSTVTVTNTFQGGADGPAPTDGAEVPIEQFFDFADPATLTATADISGSTEFPGYLLGLYDIDIDRNSISYNLVAAADDETYSNFFRTIEAGSFDRYYFTFDDAQNVNGFTSSDPSVNLRVDSDTVLVVEIGEGFVFEPGAGFTITLE